MKNFEELNQLNQFGLRERYDALLLRKGRLASPKISLSEYKAFADWLGRV